MKKLGLIGGMGPESLNDEVSPVPCLDTMQIHIQEILKTILD